MGPKRLSLGRWAAGIMKGGHRPRWLRLSDQLMRPVFTASVDRTNFDHLTTPDLQTLPYLAACHIAGSLSTSADANREGLHAVAVCLVRQCVEALSIFETGLQEPALAERMLLQWKDGRKSLGELRKVLEESAWSRYGTGLWGETWAVFLANLAKSVQPYAHYTPELQGWQFATVSYDGGNQFLAATGPGTYDPILASRITLIHSMLQWALARTLSANRPSRLAEVHEEIGQLGVALSRSKLLFHGEDWATQFAPHVLFKPGVDWIDE